MMIQSLTGPEYAKERGELWSQMDTVKHDDNSLDLESEIQNSSFR